MKRIFEFSMKQIGLSLIILLLFTANHPAQTKRKIASTGRQTSGYYLDITRPSCCNLTDKKWQEIATAFKVKGIPAFFGIYETISYGEEWKPVRLKKTVANEGWLILGPFKSSTDALAALQKLPKLLPKNDDTFNGVEAGATTDPQTWRIGMYEINGFKTSEPVQTQNPKANQAGVIEGTVIENTGGANWIGIVIESDGVRYSIELDGNSGGVETQTGDVETVGNRVRVAFKNKEKMPDGGYFLRVTSIVQIKKI